MYTKHLTLWVFLGLLFLGGRSFVNQQTSFADVTSITPYQDSLGAYRMDIAIAKNGSVTLNQQKVSSTLVSLVDTDRLNLILIDKSNQSIGLTQTLVSLPDTISFSQLKITPRLIHNYTSAVSITKINDHLFQLNTDSIDGLASYSLEIDFTKGALSLPFATKLSGLLIGYHLVWWIFLALLLPGITVIILAILILRRLKLGQILATASSDIPPANLPPAVVEALVMSHLSARSIAATIIDLARRGYLIIGYRGDDFSFGKHKNFKLPELPQTDNKDQMSITTILQAVALTKDNTDIRPFERLILSKLFTSQNSVVNRQEIEFRLGHRLFSEKMATAYSEIYQLASSHGYFIQDPGSYHKHYKNVGLGLFFIGLLGFTIGAFKFTEPKTALLAWVGMMLAALAVISISPKLPILSPKGIQAYKKWLAFKNYLVNPTPLFYTNDSPTKFEAYLPYAITLGVEKQWTARFREHPFIQPEWFQTESEQVALEDFDSQLFPLIDWVSSHLSLARTPVID